MENETKNVLYHGSPIPNIHELKPRKRYCPGELMDRFNGKENVPAAVYVTDDPACAAVHSFEWGTKDGFDLRYEGKSILLIVPVKFKNRLKRKIYIYKVSAKEFELLNLTEHTYWSRKVTKVLGVETFEDVEIAIRRFGGTLKYI